MQQNQVVAFVKDRKERAKQTLTQVHHAFQKPDMLVGITRKYTPLREDERAQAPEYKQMQATVPQGIDAIRESMVTMFDTVLTQDIGNTLAAADVSAKFGTRTLDLTGVPATHLLFLEKQLVDLGTFIQAMPILDPAEKWELDPATGTYRSQPKESVSTRKVQRPLVLYQATEQHAAQTQLVVEDISVGVWETTKFSGAITIDRKKDLIRRVIALQEAVKSAREKANATTVEWKEEGAAIFDFIFGA